MADAPEPKQGPRKGRPGRVLRWALVVLTAPLILLALCVLLAAGTAPGRALVRDLVLAELNPMLAGQLQVGELQELGPSGVRLRELTVRDPSGATALSLGTLEVRLDATSALSGGLRVDRIIARDGTVDLADLGSGRGLLAAFAPANAGPDPGEPEAEDGAFELDLQRVELDAIAVRVQLEGLGRLQAHELHARGGLSLGASLRARLDALRCRLSRDGEPLARVDSLRAELNAPGTASTVQLQAGVGESALELEARGLLPGDPAFQTAPISAALSLRPLDARLLRLADQAQLADTLKQPLDVGLEVEGSLQRPRAVLRLAPAGGGAITARLRLDAERNATLDLSSEAVVLGELIAGAPPGPLTASATVEANLKQPQQSVPFAFELADGRLAGQALPTVQAAGELLPDAVRGLSLKAQGYGGRLAFEGDLDFAGEARGKIDARLPTLRHLPRGLRGESRLGDDGSIALRAELVARPNHLRADGSLEVRSLAVAGASIAALDADFTARGDPRTPRVEAKMRGEELRHGAARVRALALDVGGGPDGYVANLRADGQRVELRGKPRPGKRLDLTLRAPELELGSLARSLGLGVALRGVVDLELRARGPLAGPALRVRVRTPGVGLKDRPTVALSIDGELDPRARTGSLQLKAQSGKLLDLALDARAQLAAGPLASWPGRLPRAELDAELTLGHLDSDLVAAFLDAPLPLDATLASRVRVSGAANEPAIEGRLDASVEAPAPLGTLALEARGSYQRGRADVQVLARDGQGPWFEAGVSIAHPEETTRAALRDVAHMARDAQVDASLKLHPRRVAMLELGAELALSRAPRQEPTAKLELEASHDGSDTTEGGCAPRRTELSARASLDAGDLEVVAKLAREGAALLELTSTATAAVTGPLSRGRRPELANLQLDGRIPGLDLSTIPFACAVARGRLGGTLRGRDLWTRKPTAFAALELRGLSLGGRRALDGRLDLRLAEEHAQLKADLQHGQRRSSLEARIPLRLDLPTARAWLPTDRPISGRVRLDELPLEALVPRGGPISRVAGTLSAALNAEGTLASPRVHGSVQPRGVAMTATAIAQPLRGIDGRLVVDVEPERGELHIESLTLRDANGRVDVRGGVVRDGTGEARGSLRFSVDDFPLRQRGRIAGELDAEVVADVTMTEERSDVAVRVEDAAVWLLGGDLPTGIGLDPHPDIVDPRTAADDAPPAEDAAPPRPLRLTLDAEDSFWVRREDFAVKLSTALQVETTEGVRVHGEVRMHRGYLQLLGRTFDLGDRSSIEFTGSDPPNPALAIEASTLNRRTGETVKVTIGGRASAPELIFQVDDAKVSAGEAAESLFGGRAGGEEASGQAQSFVGGVIGGVMGMAVRRELGEAVPILMIEPGDGSNSARIRAGFELDSLVPSFLEGIIRGVYLEGIFAGGEGQGSNQNAQGGVLIELYLPGDFVTSGQYGPGETWSLDLGWEP